MDDKVKSNNLFKGKSRKKSDLVQGLKKNTKIKIFVCLIFTIFVFFVLSIYIIFFKKYDSYEVISKEYFSNSDSKNLEQIKYFKFKNGIIRYSSDGISFINKSLKIDWSVAYNLKNLLVDVSKNFFAISSLSENEIIIFDEKGVSGRITTEYPIQRIKISDNGYLYALQSVDYTSYIMVYDKSANKLDIAIKSLLNEDGLAIDMDVSSDGTELCVDYVYLVDDNLKTKVVYYNFGEVGKLANAKRIVGVFDNLENNDFVASVIFFDNYNSQFISNNGVSFISTRILNSPELVYNYSYDNILSFTNSNDFFSIVINDLGNKKLLIFDKKGTKISNVNIDFQYENFYITDDLIIFINKNRVLGITDRGIKKFDILFNDDVNYISKSNKIIVSEMIVATNNYIQIVSLK